MPLALAKLCRDGGGENSYSPFRYSLPSAAVDYLHAQQHKHELRRDSVQQDYRSVQVNYLNLIGSYLASAAQMNLAVGR